MCDNQNVRRYGESKRLASMSPVPWLDWEQFESFGNYLFSNSLERVMTALTKIREWQERRIVAVEVDLCAVIMKAFQQSTYESYYDYTQRATLALAIHRLIKAFVAPCRRCGKLSKYTDSAEPAFVAELLIDIHDDHYTGRLRERSVLFLASEEALRWLQTYYWGRRQEDSEQSVARTKSPGDQDEALRLEKARATLKAELNCHCVITAEMISPSDWIHYFEHRNYPGKRIELKDWNRARKDMLRVILDLALSSPQDLVSIIVDDELMTQADSYFSEGSSTLTTAMDMAWKHTIRELSVSLPRLPAMLLTSIMTQIKSRFSDGKVRKTGTKSATASHSGEIVEERQRRVKRLTSWFNWLLGKSLSKKSSFQRDKFRLLKMRKTDLEKFALLDIPIAKLVKVELSKDFLSKLLQDCLRTSVLGVSFLEFEPGIAAKLRVIAAPSPDDGNNSSEPALEEPALEEPASQTGEQSTA